MTIDRKGDRSSMCEVPSGPLRQIDTCPSFLSKIVQGHLAGVRHSMKRTKKCPKCGSSDIIADAKAIDRETATWKGNCPSGLFATPRHCCLRVGWPLRCRRGFAPIAVMWSSMPIRRKVSKSQRKRQSLRTPSPPAPLPKGEGRHLQICVHFGSTRSVTISHARTSIGPVTAAP